MCIYTPVCMCVWCGGVGREEGGTYGFVGFVSSVSVSPLLTLSRSFCNAVLSALMTHISYLQSLPNPSSAGSGTDYCFQTPEERRAEQGGGWRVVIDASVIQYTESLTRPAHACGLAHMHVCQCLQRMFFISKSPVSFTNLTDL